MLSPRASLVGVERATSSRSGGGFRTTARIEVYGEIEISVAVLPDKPATSGPIEAVAIRASTRLVGGAASEHSGTAPAPGSAGPAGPRPMDSRDARDIEGVGPVFAEKLARAGLATIADISAMNPEELVESGISGLSLTQLWGLKRKAEMLRAFRVAPSLPDALLAMSLQDILDAPLETLVRVSGRSLGLVSDLSLRLRTLQILITQEATREMPLRLLT